LHLTVHALISETQNYCSFLFGIIQFTALRLQDG